MILANTKFKVELSNDIWVYISSSEDGKLKTHNRIYEQWIYNYMSTER